MPGQYRFLHSFRFSFAVNCLNVFAPPDQVEIPGLLPGEFQLSFQLYFRHGCVLITERSIQRERRPSFLPC